MQLQTQDKLFGKWEIWNLWFIFTISDIKELQIFTISDINELKIVLAYSTSFEEIS